jgi:hypothetical protein
MARSQGGATAGGGAGWEVLHMGVRTIFLCPRPDQPAKKGPAGAGLAIHWTQGRLPGAGRLRFFLGAGSI